MADSRSEAVPEAAIDAYIDVQRIMARLEQLFALGARPHANRPGLSADEQQACDLAAGWMAEAGLVVSHDPFGNVFGRLVGSGPEGDEVWTGSHLDTVPAGGRFDGALGVVGGIEALGALSRVAAPARTTAVVVFRDEEGWRFGGGTFGSRGICDGLTAQVLATRDADGVSVGEALADLGLPGAEVPVAPLPSTFLELHIEQGPALAASGHAIGSVSEIVAMLGGELVIGGRAGHAGTTPMGQRADAALAAARATVALADATAEIPGAVATVGRIELMPGAPNVIASRAILSLDLRAPDDAQLDALVATLNAVGADSASRSGCSWELRDVWRHGAVAMDPRVRSTIARSAGSLDEPVREISSGALHDAGVLAAAGVATGMVFVRSNAGGVSHTPEEDSDAASILVATRVLARALAHLSGAQGRIMSAGHLE